MVEVYYYIPADKADNAVECGIKRSIWFDKEVVINGESKKCITALLNPKDDMQKYRSDEYKCLKLELSPEYCFVADNCLYRVGLEYPLVMEAYMNSIIPIEKYIFGSYRLPECLVTSTVIAGQVSVLDKRLDSPVLFDRSEDLFLNNIIATYREENEDFYDTMLYYFYCRLADAGKVKRIEDKAGKMAVFIDSGKGKAYTIRIPDISRF